MKSVAEGRGAKYTFRGHTGYLIHPALTNQPQNLLALGHTAAVTPWRDDSLHLHTHSEEYFLLWQGVLEFQVHDFRFTLHAGEMLVLRPLVPHAIVGGQGEIEHFGMRAPILKDKQVAGEIPQNAPLKFEDARLLTREWGNRIPLNLPQHQNCWLLGAGSAQFPSAFLSLAYLDFPTSAAANAGIGPRHQPHYHQQSWEYYIVLQGAKTLQVEEELVTMEAGEILEVPPQVIHSLSNREAPYRGLTIRVPVTLDDKVIVNE